MTRNYAEEDALKKGVASLGVAEGKTDGTVQISGGQATIGLGGSGASLEVLGPYVINYNDDPAINDHAFFVPGAPTMGDGFWITETLVEFTEQWDDGGGPGFSMQAKLEVGPVEDSNLSEPINTIDPYSGTGNIMVDAFSDSGAVATKRQFRIDLDLWSAEQGITITGGKLAMEIYSNRGAFTSGQIRVWALGQT